MISLVSAAWFLPSITRTTLTELKLLKAFGFGLPKMRAYSYIANFTLWWLY